MMIWYLKPRRAGLVDEWRGLAILLMVIYHTLYDLAEIFGIGIPIFTSPWLVGLQLFIAFSFVTISGISCRYSRNNLKRGAVCFCCGMIMTFATAIAMPGQLILFGVLHFLGIAMVIYGLLERVLTAIHPMIGMIASLILFVLTYRISYGYIGIPYLFQIRMPELLYQTNWLFPLGFYSPTFFSSDYYPLLPWLFLFLFGTYAGAYVRENHLPEFAYRTRLPKLAALGRHTMIIYLVHQPIIYGLLWAIFAFFKLI